MSCMKSIDPKQFSEAIPSSQINHDPPSDLDSLVSCYNESLRSHLDMCAHVLTRDINVTPLVGWFSEDIRNAKRLGRNAEKTWRATRLSVDLAAFKKERNRVVNLNWWMRHAVFTIISLSKITAQTRGGCSRQVRVYWIWRKIDPFHTLCFTSCKQYGSVFLLPRLPISGQSWTAFLLSKRPTPTWNMNLVILYFPTSNAKPDWYSSSNWLHLQRTNLASSCLNSLLPAITNMANLSLQTGYFAETWNPSLKKPGLDLLFKNFRLISNLQFVTWLQIISVFPQLQSVTTTNY